MSIPAPTLARIDGDDVPTHPLEFVDVWEVDDNGGHHVETRMTARLLVELVDRKLLTLTGNIRPEHQRDLRSNSRIKKKIDKWTEELLLNNAVIGNISVRLDPSKAVYELYHDDETNKTNMVIEEGKLDCAVDSQSRITAILNAANHQVGTMDLDIRFQVRIWVLDDDGARKVATIYNTRGDKVNDSTAKYAYSETREQEIARRLVNGSPHLGIDNIEVLSNAVSASSHKLTAYNTISRALELSWDAGPLTAQDVEDQSKWLIDAWDALVQVRPEFGSMSTPGRREQRKTNIASSAVVIHTLIGVMSTMYAGGVDPATAFQALAITPERGDVFAFTNPVWLQVGVVTPTGTGKGSGYRISNGFPARKVTAKVLQGIMGLTSVD